MSLGQVVLLVYAALMGAGGVFGYIKAGSSASLIAGIAAAVLSVAAYFISTTHALAGYTVGAVVALAVGGRFLVASLRAHEKGEFKFMPQGMVLVVSAVALVILVYAAVKAARS